MKALIVDDHTATREGLRYLLESEWPGCAPGLASNPQQALAALAERLWDLIIIDISQPGRDGLALLREFKKRLPSIRILVHTVHPEVQFGVRAIRAGADGYITKDAPMDHLLSAIQKTARGGRYVTPSLGELMANALSNQASVHTVESLSDRELEILRMITTGKSPSEIAGRLALSIKTVSTYRSRLLDKLRLRTTADLIRFGIENDITEA